MAFGRVYIGSTNGSVYSFSTRDGRLAWRKGTGNYVYSSAAVADEPGVGPTVYVGSYDGTLYALNARSAPSAGATAPRADLGGIQIVGDLVFYSTLNGYTTAVGAATGRRVWTVHKGKFNPVISTGATSSSTARRASSPRPAARQGPRRGGAGRPAEAHAAEARPRAPGAGARGPG